MSAAVIPESVAQLQLQLAGASKMIHFDQYGNTIWSVPSTFAVWPWGGSNTAKLQSEFPLLASCTDKTLKPPVSCPGPGDLLWNAKQDLAQQLTNDPNCVQAAQNNVFNIFNNNGGDSNGKPIYANHFVGYLQDNPHFYNGPIAKVFYAYLCGQPQRANCGGSTLTVAEAWDSGTTALTDTPSYPFQSFWHQHTRPRRQTTQPPTVLGLELIPVITVQIFIRKVTFSMGPYMELLAKLITTSRHYYTSQLDLESRLASAFTLCRMFLANAPAS
jgi:hypothetical protein